MKTRILSAAVMIALIGAFLALGFKVSPLFITVFIVFLSALGTYELLHNAAKITNKAANTVAMIGSALFVLFSDAAIRDKLQIFSVKAHEWDSIFSAAAYNIAIRGDQILCIVYFIVAVFIILARHREFDIAKSVTFLAMPKILSYGFSLMGSIITGNNGFYYLLMMINFACICDTGAYFTGVAIGKHKLCPEISPKKTVEGAIGGIVSSLVVAGIIMIVYNLKFTPVSKEKVISTMIFSIPLCIIGMAGDLIASQIKRSAGIKDYGNLIPGHGGILDRFDSMLLIAPAIYVLSMCGMI